MSNNFIIIPNRAFKLSESKLSPLELFIYSYLYRSRLEYTDQWITYTKIDFIKSMIKCKIDGVRNEKYITIRKNLLSLKDKKYIISNVDNDTDTLDLLTVSFPPIDKDAVNEGFLKMPYTLFDLFDDRDKYYIYAYIDSGYNEKHQKHYNNTLSLSKWVRLLEVSSKTTVKKRIDEMNRVDAVPRIYKYSGDYNGTEKQEENTYVTRPSADFLFMWNNFYDENGKSKHKKSARLKDDDIIYYPLEGEMSVKEFNEIIEFSSWDKRNDEPYSINKYVELTIEDYYIYKTCEKYNLDREFVLRCKKIIENKTKAFNYDGCFEEWEERYNSQDHTSVIKEIQVEREERARFIDEYMRKRSNSDFNPFD